VARRARTGASETLATVHRVPLDLELGEVKSSSTAPPFALQEGDQVFIRRLPGYSPLSTVEITGEVLYPGPYTLEARTERVTDIIKRAGGLTREAYARGFRLFRDGSPVGINFVKALARPNSSDDIVLEPGDRIEVPRLDPTVLVNGAVAFQTRVRYEPGLSMRDYIARAGGVSPEGHESRASVRYPNGELRTPRRLLGNTTYPRIEPGSTITVPLRPEDSGFDLDTFLTRGLTVLSTLATIILTIRATN
jgi:protein involved in polysaccharide export with SLBB domain